MNLDLQKHKASRKAKAGSRANPRHLVCETRTTTRFGEDNETSNVIRRPIKAKSEATRHEKNRNVCGKRRNEAERRNAHQCQEGKRNQ